MIRGALVLRPEPGAARTAARLEALGVEVRRRPLFTVTSVAWSAPDRARFDALLLTSANAVRHAGEQMQGLRGLPALAVGEATAAAALDAGLKVALTGNRDAAALVASARARGFTRLLHLAGRDRGELPGVDQVTVYASEALPIDVAVIDEWRDKVALLHSPRAAARFAELVDRAALPRARIAVAALSPAVQQAAGAGWIAAVTADIPSDERLVAATAGLIDRGGAASDKQWA